jgi:hypothetical protein
MGNRPLLPGLILICLGVLFLLPAITPLESRHLWPLILIGVGAAFVITVIVDHSKYGFLMPGSILLVLGGLFLYCSIEGWDAMRTLWPLFILAPGLGFLGMASVNREERSLLTPGFILTGIAAVFLIATAGSPVFLSAGLILVGAYLLFGRRPKRAPSQDPQPPGGS